MCLALREPRNPRPRLFWPPALWAHSGSVTFAFCHLRTGEVTGMAIGTGQPVPSDSQNMDYLNSLQISQAERYVASSDGDFRLVRRMISDNGKYRRGLRADLA